MPHPVVFQILTIIALVFASPVAPAQESDKYEQAILKLRKGHDRDEALQAQEFLRSSGKDAFPTLLKYLYSTEPAAGFTYPRAVETKEGQPYQPTLGDAVFLLMQDAIEGNRPRGFRQFYVITWEKIEQWLSEHADLSLEEMQIAAARESMQLIEQKKPFDQESMYQMALDHIQQRIAELSK
ncbi:MAG: hypothetical protein CMO55_06775 [Verrucomicrobiales bacterium]|nr:hypothetical protein [Verrucomicrobiales bacterium]